MFEIGWIPEGWERGDELSVNLPKDRNSIGYFLNANVNRRYIKSDPSNSCCYYLCWSHVEKFEKWLKWWNSPPETESIAIGERFQAMFDLMRKIKT